MSRKEEFLLAVFYGALARDIEQDTTEAQGVARYALGIPDAAIPPNAVAAAQVFLNYCYGERARPWRWMAAGRSYQ
jgi:hypothetical protein